MSVTGKKPWCFFLSWKMKQSKIGATAPMQQKINHTPRGAKASARGLPFTVNGDFVSRSIYPVAIQNDLSKIL